jgi:hypothetical protein
MPRKNGKTKRVKESAAIAETPNQPNEDGIAALAYKLWQERGCPTGSDQEDWFRAENELKNRKVLAEGAS